MKSCDIYYFVSISFPQHYLLLSIHPRCYRVFHCSNIQQFIQPFYCWLPAGLLQFSEITNNTAINILEYVFWCTYIHIWGKGIYQTVGHQVCTCPTYTYATKLFSKWLHHFILPPTVYECFDTSISCVVGSFWKYFAPICHIFLFNNILF